VVLGGKGTLKKDLSTLRDTFIETAAQAASERLLLAERCGALALPPFAASLLCSFPPCSPPSVQDLPPSFIVCSTHLLSRRLFAPRCKESELALQERQEEVARLQVHCRYAHPTALTYSPPERHG
jgi:hypothetical protein